MSAIRFAFAVVSIAALCSKVGAADDQPLELRVMSFNIRYGTAADGANHWDERKGLLVDTIRRFDPDLLGTQETLGFQRDYLAGQLLQYDVVGVGRDDGREAGEMMALYFKTERFEQLDGGHFWLSETPDQPGSRSWDSSLPRMVTWVKLGQRGNAAASPLLFFNTHFDHLGAEARVQSARLLRARLAAIGDSCSLVVTGDFNTPEASPPYCALFDDVDGRPSPLVDAYRLVHPVRDANEGTFSGFNAAATAGPRIDWIGVSRDWQVLQAGIDRTQQDGRTPSDHYPVTSLLRKGDKSN